MDEHPGWSIILWCIVGLIVFASVAGVWAGVAAMDRYQAIKNAENQVHINNIIISQTEQLIQVEKQRAQIRVQDAIGIAESQKIINATLTPLYLQHEAIQAQLKMAGSQNHTQIYIPTGANGIPLVFTAPAPSK
jgi:uncharacterized iron-regulated membrane protein